MTRFDPDAIETPAYIVDRTALESNLQRLDRIQRRTGCHILLALKGFAMFSLFGLIRQYLHGTAASSLDEARLGFEEFGGPVHLCAPAYKESEFGQLMQYCSHIVFNSFTQWQRLAPLIKAHPKPIRSGIRVNPQHREVKTAIYDPCGPGSRLGVTLANFDERLLEGISGLHFHSLCEMNADALERTLAVVEQKFGRYFDGLTWINFGGGHHITKSDYEIDRLISLITTFKHRYDLDVFLEPGEAVALNTGVLVAQVLDIGQNDIDFAILDTSAATHMPDVLEMPYRPELIGAGKPGEFAHTYRLGGPTCLAGDIIGDYSFRAPLCVGQRLVFLDMAHYTMVKTNTFNGVRLPAIGICEPDGSIRIVRTFNYADYRNRLS